MTHLFKTPGGEVRWGWKAILLIVGTIFFGIILNTLLMTILTIGYASQAFPQEQAMEKATAALSGFSVQVLLSTLQLGFLLWLVRWLVVKMEKGSFHLSKLGLIQVNRSKSILYGAMLAVVLSLLTVGIGSITGSLKFLGSGLDLFGSTQVLVTTLLAVILAFASGFGEEVAFRGYLQARIAQRYNPWTAIVIVAVLFALSHPLNTSAHPLLYLATAILVGMLFGVVFLRTGSLWMGISLHTAWNYMQIAVLSVRSSADERFFGAPLFVFDNISGTTQMLIEFTVIVLALVFVLWVTKPTVNTSEKAQREQALS